MLECVSKLKFYFAPRNLFVPLIGMLVLGILKIWIFFNICFKFVVKLPVFLVPLLYQDGQFCTCSNI